MTRRLFVLLLLGTVLLSAAPLTVFVSIPPLAEAVSAVGGECVEVRTLLPAGSSPESYQPDARMLSSLGQARVLFVIGVPFEKVLLPKLRQSFPQLQIVDGAQGMTIRNFPRGGRDPHVWLSASNMIRYAETVAGILSRLAPEHAEEFRARLGEYQSSLRQANGRISALLAPLKGRSVLVYHPAFGYFLEEYGIRQEAIEQEGKEPTGGALQATLRNARKQKYPAIFVQPQFSPRSAQVVSREVGCAVMTLDPLPDKLTPGLEALAETIARAYHLPKK